MAWLIEKAAKACIVAILGGAYAAPSPAQAQNGSPVSEAPAGFPDWLKIRGEVRLRYETLDGQFRAGGSGGDQLLALRSLALVEVDSGPVAFGIEVQDSRAYLDDAGTPLSTSIVNPLDILQAYARIDLENALGFDELSVKIGRQTLGIGSQRVLERVDMANVIFSYTGLYARGVTKTGDELHVTAFSPTGRMPGDRTSLADNAISGDEEQWGRRGWGVHWREKDVFGAAGMWAEAYLYGLLEDDAKSNATPNRNYLQPGFRIFRAASNGTWDFEVEAAKRSGQRRQTSAPGDQRDLKVNASMLYAHVGYTFDHAWRPRLAIDYYFSSGDDDPADARYGQFERLFGSRRTDLGNTGIHGPLTTANINAPGFRFELTPNEHIDARIAYKAASLENARDAWIDARLIDPTGASGDFIGHAWDFRSRAWLAPDRLRLEVGASALFPGEFAKRAPNSPRPDRTLFAYFQVTQHF